MSQLHNVVWDDKEHSYIEEVPEGELPDCLQTPSRHHWIESISTPFKICSLCGKVE